VELVSDYSLARTWTATDLCGLKQLILQTITVVDAQTRFVKPSADDAGVMPYSTATA
jgi:hypothetical protein